MAEGQGENVSVGRIVEIQFGQLNGLFGLHFRLAFSVIDFSDYTLTDLDEIRELMDSFRAETFRRSNK